MRINDKIRNGKLQYDINREVAKISALLSGKKLTNMKILPAGKKEEEQHKSEDHKKYNK